VLLEDYAISAQGVLLIVHQDQSVISIHLEAIFSYFQTNCLGQYNIDSKNSFSVKK
jgi:hypothetical protein